MKREPTRALEIVRIKGIIKHRNGKDVSHDTYHRIHHAFNVFLDSQELQFEGSVDRGLIAVIGEVIE